MSLSDQPLTAIERARIAYELMTARQRDVALQRRSRARSRNIRFAVLIASVLALLIGTAIYNGWIPTSLRSSIFTRSADDGKFGETRTGQVRSFVKGNTCRELQFNNERGVYVGGNFVPCEIERTRETPQPSKGARVNSIRDAFTGGR